MNDAHSGRRHAAGGPEDGQDPYTQPQSAPYYGSAQQYGEQYGEQYAGYDAYEAYGQSHDPYGQPVGQAAQPAPAAQQYYDPYGQQVQAPPAPAPQPGAYDGHGYDGHGYGGDDGQGGYDGYGRQWIPQQQTEEQRPPEEPAPPHQSSRHRRSPQHEQPHQSSQSQPQSQPQPPRQRSPRDEPRRAASDYRTEQFSFIEEPDEDSEDVIDWLKFAETRTERRDERKRKGRNRVVALAAVLTLAVAGGVGYLWYAGALPGMSDGKGGAAAANGPQQRDVIVVHLRDLKTGGSSTALLVDNATTGKGTTILVPNTLSVNLEGGGGTPLAKSVQSEGTTPTRDALGTLLGAEIKGSWRLDTPYLENLVESVGGITLDTDAPVPGAKAGDAPLVPQGRGKFLNGQAAVGYATLLAPGEPQTKQLQRFGQVLQAVLKKLSADPAAATATVKSLHQIPDPSLTEDQLGATLAHLARQAQNGSYETTLLPVRPDGTLGQEATDGVVKPVLGGTVGKADPSATPRVGVRDATGDKQAAARARIVLVNGGYTVVEGGAASAPQNSSQVTYGDPAQAGKAREVATTLGIPESAVKQAEGGSNAEVTVVLGRDYKPR
ncbi:LytR C-terminal domain-containing protein [Streptomyces sp. URMC 123]|uniref:LytR C-terminal domain-containing protein n=1 Tax=Streptomyces sp. URMC 123 TaxID=3423403 RepID=UPI003F1ABD05